jgi:quinol monooxygenase YgiN
VHCSLKRNEEKKMIAVLASITVKLDEKAKFIEIFKENVPNVLAEKGCIEYAPMVDAHSGILVQEKDDAMVTVVERWESIEDLKAHLKAPHMDAYREKVADIVQHVTLKVLEKV